MPQMIPDLKELLSKPGFVFRCRVERDGTGHGIFVCHAASIRRMLDAGRITYDEATVLLDESYLAACERGERKHCGNVVSWEIG